MRILILGNNYSSKCFFKFFEKDKDNIIFSTIFDYNYINFLDDNDIIDFCEANEINFILITDEKYINDELIDKLNEFNISIFSPSEYAVNIINSKAYAKKFMHKFKIPTSAFQIFEKPQNAYDFISTVNFPIAIKPDNHNFRECTQFAETYNNAKKIISNLFSTDNKKIIIENYIEGKNISVWTLSNGYSAEILGISSKYQNNIAYFEPEFVNEDIKNEIYETIITPAINGLSYQDEEYIGILGFDIILNKENKPILIGFNNFFDDINVNFFTKGFNIDWLNVFEATLIGDVFTKFEFKPINEYMLTIRQNENINLINTKTKSNIELYLKELDFDLKEYQEAQKIWSY